AGTVDAAQIEAAERFALEPFDRSGGGNPFALQNELQEKMQDLVGIVRREDEMKQALEAIASLRARAAQVKVEGNRDYNPGWHTPPARRNLLPVAECTRRAALERKESRGGHFRDDFPEKSKEGDSFNIVVKLKDGAVRVDKARVAPMPAELKAAVEEQKK